MLFYFDRDLNKKKFMILHNAIPRSGLKKNRHEMSPMAPNKTIVNKTKVHVEIY